MQSLWSGCREKNNHNFIGLVDGIGELKNRLGFNPFKTNLEGHNYIDPFKDSDSMLFKSKDSKGNWHNIFEAAKYFYEKTGTKFAITTAGWKNKIKTKKTSQVKNLSQEAAESLIEHPEYIYHNHIDISINTFHSLMEKSKKCLEEGKECLANGEIKRAEKLRNSAEKLRNIYINMMANVIKTIIKLSDKSKNKISCVTLLHRLQPDNQGDHGWNAMLNLSEEIFEKLESEGVNIQHFGRIMGGKRDHIEYRSIGSIGRAKINFFDEKDIYNLERDVSDKPIIIAPDGSIWENNALLGNITVRMTKLPLKLNFNSFSENNIEKNGVWCRGGIKK